MSIHYTPTLVSIHYTPSLVSIHYTPSLVNIHYTPSSLLCQLFSSFLLPRFLVRGKYRNKREAFYLEIQNQKSTTIQNQMRKHLFWQKGEQKEYIIHSWWQRNTFQLGKDSAPRFQLSFLPANKSIPLRVSSVGDQHCWITALGETLFTVGIRFHKENVVPGCQRALDSIRSRISQQWERMRQLIWTMPLFWQGHRHHQRHRHRLLSKSGTALEKVTVLVLAPSLCQVTELCLFVTLLYVWVVEQAQAGRCKYGSALTFLPI